MPDAPAVSIVLPVYNGLAYLEQSIASVLGQTCTSWELVAVDDGSDDGTAEWLTGLDDPRIRTVAEQHTGNLSRVRNVGIAGSSATWVAFLDADDVWLPHKLERQLAFHAAHPGIRWSYTGRMVIDASGARLPDEKFPWHPVSGWILPDLLVHAAKIASPTMMVERALLQELGGLDERFHYAGDYELRLRLATGWECGVVAEPLAMIRQHRASRTTRRPESALALADVYRQFSRSAHAADLVRICRKQETFYRLKAARIRFGRREWRSAWHTLGSALRVRPLDRRVYRMGVHGLMQMARSLRAGGIASSDNTQERIRP